MVYGEPGCCKCSTTGCFRSAWDFRQTLLRRHDGGGGNRWMDEMLSSRIPRCHRGGSQRRKPSMRACWILQVEINPLKFTRGEFSGSQQSPPPLLRKYSYDARLLLSQKVRSPREAEIWSRTWEQQHKCFWQVLTLEPVGSIKSRADAAKTDRWDVCDPSPQTAIFWLLRPMRRRAMWDFCHEGQPTKSLSDLNGWFNSPCIHSETETEVRIVEHVGIFRPRSDVLPCGGMLKCIHIFQWQAAL